MWSVAARAHRRTEQHTRATMLAVSAIVQLIGFCVLLLSGYLVHRQQAQEIAALRRDVDRAALAAQHAEAAPKVGEEVAHSRFAREFDTLRDQVARSAAAAAARDERQRLLERRADALGTALANGMASSARIGDVQLELGDSVRVSAPLAARVRRCNTLTQRRAPHRSESKCRSIMRTANCCERPKRRLRRRAMHDAMPSALRREPRRSKASWRQCCNDCRESKRHRSALIWHGSTTRTLAA